MFPRILLIVILANSAAVLACAQQPQRVKSKITVGKDTTYFTEPIDKDGYVDYVTALNNRLKKGVTPQNNANVLFWLAMGPRPYGAKMPNEHFQWLGIEPLAEKGDYFVGLDEFAMAKMPPPLRNNFIDLASELGNRPWQAKDQPHVAEWLKMNQKPLAVVIEASKRSHYYMPLTPVGTKNEPGMLLSARVPSVQKCREFSTALCARANLHLGEGRVDDAWQDILSSYRLARLISGGSGTLIEWLVGVALENVSRAAVLSFIERAGADGKRLRACLQDIENLPPCPGIARNVDLCERLWFIDAVTSMQRTGPDALMMGTRKEGDPPAQKVDLVKAQAFADAFDWDLILRFGNGWFDRTVAVLRIDDRAKREAEFTKLEVELKKVKGENAGAWQLLQTALNKEARSKKFANIMVTLLMPASRKVQQAGDRNEQNLGNLRLAFALALYKVDEGKYPAKLDALAPKYVPRIPNDLFSGKDLIYRPGPAGYLLYSVGQNGRDEQGQTYGDNPPGDDLPVRMPSVRPKGK